MTKLLDAARAFAQVWRQTTEVDYEWWKSDEMLQAVAALRAAIAEEEAKPTTAVAFVDYFDRGHPVLTMRDGAAALERGERVYVRPVAREMTIPRGVGKTALREAEAQFSALNESLKERDDLRAAIAEEGASLHDRDSLINTLADMFCRWPLPETVCADLCATKASTKHRTGTNLLTTVEARQMLAFVLHDVDFCDESHTHKCRHPECVLQARDEMIDDCRTEAARLTAERDDLRAKLAALEAGGEPVEYQRRIVRNVSQEKTSVWYPISKKDHDEIQADPACAKYGVQSRALYAHPAPAYVPMTEEDMKETAFGKHAPPLSRTESQVFRAIEQETARRCGVSK